MKQIASSFAAATGIEMEVLPSLGSNGSLRAVADGVIDVAVSAHKLSPEELSRGLEAVPFARTALVFVTSHSKPNSWRSEDLARIFDSKIRKWNDGTPIKIILRTKVDTDTKIISRIFPGMREAIDQARQRPDLPVASTDQDSAELAEGLTGSFVQAGLSQIVSEKRNLHLVPINGVEPSLENLKNGTYPYEKPFILVFKPGNRNANALQKISAFAKRRGDLARNRQSPGFGIRQTHARPDPAHHCRLYRSCRRGNDISSPHRRDIFWSGM